MDGMNGESRITPWKRCRPRMTGFRLLAGILLLSWGLALAVHGFGLSGLPVGRLIDLWWPLPVALWALIELLRQLLRGARRIGMHLLALLLAALALVANLHVAHIQGWTIFWAVVVLGAGFQFLRGSWTIGSSHRSGAGWQVGDIDIGMDLGANTLHARAERGRSHSSGQLIGDVRLDLSQTALPEGETPFDLACMVGDITVLVPDGLAVAVEADTMVGDIRVFQEQLDGIGRHLRYETQGYAEAPVRVRIAAQAMVGDITVRAV